jgi:hypothetical protein
MNSGIKLLPIVIIAVLLALAASFILADKDAPTLDATLSDGPRGLQLDVTLEDFNSIGAYFGCDLDVAFGDHRHSTATFTDSSHGVAHYSLGIIYSKSSNTMTLSLSGGNLAHETGLAAGDTITLKVLGENRFYKYTPDYRAGHTDKRSDYDDDQKFGNYRELSGGNLKDDMFYRSSNPWNYTSERAQYCDQYYREIGVENLICMDLSMDGVERRCKALPDAYSTGLYEKGKVHAKALSSTVHAHPEQALFVLQSLLDTEGSVGIFCTYGKDRTGAYCAMIEGLAGASFEEIREDFMESMCNYYHFEKDTPEYEAVASMYVDRVLYLYKHYEYIDDYLSVDWSQMDFQDYVPEEVMTKYLIEVAGVPSELIDAVKDRITA